MSRFADWPTRLAGFVESRRMAPFSWGSNDCVTFAADWIAEATGTDPIAALRGRWTDEQSAAEVIGERETLRNWAGAVLGVETARVFAGRGDVVLVRLGGRESLAVCLGDKLVAPGDDRLIFAPMRLARAAWRV
jgi:hypothetical protein